MRYKVIPEPVDEALLVAVRDAVPLVPGSVEDCCTRVRGRTDLPSRERAREWLTFCEALELVVSTDRGYHRHHETANRTDLADRFERRVFGASEVLDALAAADDTLDAHAAFEAVRPAVPRWERDRYPDWETEWTERVRRLLEWGLVFSCVERAAGGYRPG